MSGAGGRVALKVEMAVSIIDLIALMSFQSAGGLGFAAANCGGLVSSFARMNGTELPRRLQEEERWIVPVLPETEACLEERSVGGK